MTAMLGVVSLCCFVPTCYSKRYISPGEYNAVFYSHSQYNVNTRYIAADLRSVEEIKALISSVFHDNPEGIDILINNAGMSLGLTLR